MANNFKLSIVTPDGKKIEDEVTILNVLTKGGALGIMKGHLPLVSTLETSHLNYKKNNESIDICISGGIINVNKDEVIVLAESFETKDEIDKERAEASKARAEKRLSSKDSNIDILRAELALKRALNRLSL